MKNLRHYLSFSAAQKHSYDDGNERWKWQEWDVWYWDLQVRWHKGCNWGRECIPDMEIWQPIRWVILKIGLLEGQIWCDWISKDGHTSMQNETENGYLECMVYVHQQTWDGRVWDVKIWHTIGGITEMGWKDCGIVKQHDCSVFYSSNIDDKRNKVGFIVHNSLWKLVLSYETINSQMMSIHLSSKPFNLMLIQVYAPTKLAEEEEEEEEFYSTLEQMIVKTPSRQDIIIICRDFNAKIGKKTIMTAETGLYGLGVTKNTGQWLNNFCTETC